MQRRRTNFVTALQDLSGDWCSDQSQLRGMAIKFSSGCARLDAMVRGQFCQCSAEMRPMFLAPIHDEEVTISNMVSVTQGWKWHECVIFLPTPIIHRLAATLPPRPGAISDGIG
ncbi:hypothetical protein V6N13_042782 [Hibiscus sabdariffa]